MINSVKRDYFLAYSIGLTSCSYFTKEDFLICFVSSFVVFIVLHFKHFVNTFSVYFLLYCKLSVNCYIVKRTFAIRFRYLLMNAVALRLRSNYTVSSCISFGTVVISRISPTREPQKIRPLSRSPTTALISACVMQ